jgi:hypothetical protein
MAALWQDGAHQAYRESVFAARAGDLEEARCLVAYALRSDLLSRKAHNMISGT